MCVVSMVTDHYTDKWRPFVQPGTLIPLMPGDSIGTVTTGLTFTVVSPLTAEEITQFRRDAEELRTLLDRAREYDRRNHEPNCELDSKRQMIKAIAAALGIDVS